MAELHQTSFWLLCGFWEIFMAVFFFLQDTAPGCFKDLGEARLLTGSTGFL